MKHVSAVLFLLFFLSGCSNSSTSYDNEVVSIMEQNVIFSAPGDFDGDKVSENMSIIKKQEGKYELQFTDGSIQYNKELIINLDNYSAYIHDVNCDGKEDFIICVIENNCEDIYAFCHSGNIYTLYSPEMLNESIKLIKKNNCYMIKCSNFEKKFTSTKDLKLKFYFTDIDYTDWGPIFEVDGALVDFNDSIVSSISAAFSINRNGDIDIQRIDLLPSEAVDEH